MEPKLLSAERFVDCRIGISYRYVYSSTEYLRPHFHDYYEIFILLEGSVLHLVNGSTVPLEAGDVVFIRPHDTHDYVYGDSRGFDMLNITFTQETVKELFSFLGEGFEAERLTSPYLPPTLSLSDAEREELARRMTDIKLIGEDRPERLRTALRMLIFWLITEIFAKARNSAQGSAPGWLSSLRKDLKADGNFIEGIKAIPALTDKSREHVSRSMKKYYGETVSEYINGLRLSYISNMLRHSDHKIVDIIFESGFNSVPWCCKCFKEKYGVTMQEYRQKSPK